MNAEILTLCDSAELGSDGRFHIRGSYSRLACVAFPSVLPKVVVAIRVRFELAEDGRHSLDLGIYNLDDMPIAPPAKGTFKQAAVGNDSHSWQVATVEIENVRFDGPEDFRVDLAIDGAVIASSVLVVVAT